MGNTRIRRRENWIDYAKFIGIVLVVFGHILNKDNNPALFHWIYSFHMPLFFILGGYLVKENESVETTLKKANKSLLIPYISFYLITYLLETALSLQKAENIFSYSENILKPFIGLLVGEGIKTDFSINTNIPLWFLLSLFFCKVFFQFVIKIKCNKTILLIILNVVSISFVLLLQHFNINIYFSFDSALLVIPFFTLGYLLKTLSWDMQLSTIKKLLVALTLLVVSISVYGVNVASGIPVDVVLMQFGSSLLLFYIIGAIGSLAIIFFSKAIEKKNFKFSLYYGQNSLIIMGFHFCLIHFLYPFIIKVKSIVNYPFIPSLAEAIEILILVFILMYPIIYLINKHFPFILGKFKAKD